MCSRYAMYSPRGVSDLIEVPDEEFVPSYNIAPSQRVLAVRQRPDARRETVGLRWGLIPAWAKDPGIAAHTINARSETVAEKPAFRAAFRQRRCLLPANGFYEWQTLPRKVKQPFYIRLAGQEGFAFAGLWERWQSPDGPPVETCTILTTASNDRLRFLHDRMPVILPPDAYAAWLDPATPPEKLHELLHPTPADAVTLYPVTPQMNKPAHNAPDCITPLPEPPPAPQEPKTLFDL